jgi:hypothetical protein
MIAGTEKVVTVELSLPRMSDGEDNDDLYDSDAPSEDSERDEDSPQGSRVDISWLTNSDPVSSTSSSIASLVPTSTVVTNSPTGARMDTAPATAPTNTVIDALLVRITTLIVKITFLVPLKLTLGVRLSLIVFSRPGHHPFLHRLHVSLSSSRAKKRDLPGTHL